MRKIFFMPIVAAVFMMLFPASGFTATEADPYVTPLLAGQTIPVGEVRVWEDENNIYVKYVITDADWCLIETHLAVEQNFADIPVNSKGNPIPGAFEYGETMDCLAERLYTIPLSWDAGIQLYIAAHAVVQTIVGYEDPDLAAFAGMLPAQANMIATDPFLGGPAYFPAINVDAGDDPLTGAYTGWCVSTSIRIKRGVLYNANVFSSYDPMLPAGLVDFPGNLEKINWILNQNFVGKPTSCNLSLPTYTYGSVQRAIWTLIDDVNSTLSLGPYSKCQVAEILAGANQYGLYYEPDCNEFVGVLLQPFTPQGLPAQPVIIPVPLPCEPILDDETAWAFGDGQRFIEQGNWGTYFTYNIGQEIGLYMMETPVPEKIKEPKKPKNPRGIELP